jgi:hypothetical protein
LSESYLSSLRRPSTGGNGPSSGKGMTARFHVSQTVAAGPSQRRASTQTEPRYRLPPARRDASPAWRRRGGRAPGSRTGRSNAGDRRDLRTARPWSGGRQASSRETAARRNVERCAEARAAASAMTACRGTQTRHVAIAGTECQGLALRAATSRGSMNADSSVHVTACNGVKSPCRMAERTRGRPFDNSRERSQRPL